MSTRLSNGAANPPTTGGRSAKTPPRHSCDTCFRIGRWFPPVFISAIVAWSYYAYVVNLCFGFISSTVIIVFYLIFYHVVFVVFVFVYYRAIFSEPAGVPDEFFPSDSLIMNYYSETNINQRRRLLYDFARTLPVIQRNVDGSIRFCDKCQCCKPDRAHHCGVIGKCALKMDHFCPWVNNTVAYSNYKLFMLFLFYAIVYCLYVASTSAPYFVEIWTTQSGEDVSSLIKFNVLFVFFVALMFSLSVFALFSYHVYLTLTNQSTIESFHPPYFQNGPDRRGYRMSFRENWRQVFGNDPRLWFLPVCTSTVDGIVFPSRFRAQPSDVEGAANGSLAAPANRAPSTEQLVNVGDSSMPTSFTPIASANENGGYGSATAPNE